jgi:hypothetical protein
MDSEYHVIECFIKLGSCIQKLIRKGGDEQEARKVGEKSVLILALF